MVARSERPSCRSARGDPGAHIFTSRARTTPSHDRSRCAAVCVSAERAPHAAKPAASGPSTLYDPRGASDGRQPRCSANGLYLPAQENHPAARAHAASSRSLIGPARTSRRNWLADRAASNAYVLALRCGSMIRRSGLGHTAPGAADTPPMPSHQPRKVARESRFLALASRPAFASLGGVVPSRPTVCCCLLAEPWATPGRPYSPAWRRSTPVKQGRARSRRPSPDKATMPFHGSRGLRHGGVPLTILTGAPLKILGPPISPSPIRRFRSTRHAPDHAAYYAINDRAAGRRVIRAPISWTPGPHAQRLCPGTQRGNHRGGPS